MIFKCLVNNLFKKLYIVSFCALIFTQLCSNAAEKKASAVVDADKVFYDKKNDLMIAEGNVEVFRDGVLINAQRLTFDKKKNILIATGDVRIVEPSGEEFFGTQAEILRDVKESIIYDLHAKLKNTINLGAAKAHYFVDQKKLDMKKASLTTCKVCKGKNPHWQFNSSNIKYTEEDYIVTHTNSFVELYGIPIFYMPYFYHYAPNAPPKSGLLMPSYKYNTYYGNAVQMNYYHRFSNSADLLYSPLITKEQGILHQVDYNQMFNDATLKFGGAFNKPKQSKKVGAGQSVSAKYPTNRYQYDLQYKQKISDEYKFKMLLNRVSDKNFLRNYYKNPTNYLTSDIALDYNKERSFANIKALYFQGLRDQDNSEQTPHALPSINYHNEWNLKKNNFNLDLDVLHLDRKKGLDVNRYITEVQYDRSEFFYGLELKNKINLRNSFYEYSNRDRYVPINSSSITNVKKNKNEIIPQYELYLAYPLLSNNYDFVSVIQPVTQLIISPNFSHEHKIVNEDSFDVEVTDANIFSNNRYSGYDRFEGGTRLNYGLMGSTSHMSNPDVYYFYMVGQSYQFKKNRDFTPDSGLSEKLSDIVGHFGLSPIKGTTIFYRFRADQKDMVIRRNEFNINLSYNPFFLDTKLIKYNYKSVISPKHVTESLQLNPRFALNKNWSLEGNVTRNANKEKRFMVSSGAGIVYNDQCAWYKLRVEKDYTHDRTRSIKKSTTVIFDFILKGL